MAITHQDIRRGRRGNRIGFLVTLALHGGLLAAVGIAHSQPAPPLIRQVEFVSAEMVTLGKPPDNTSLPRITQPPRSTALPKVLTVVNDPNARPARKDVPRPEDPKLSKETKTSPRRPRWLDSIAPEELPVGAAIGSTFGPSTQAVGDQYLGAITRVLWRNYSLPAGMAPDQIPTPPVIRFRFSDDGTISDVTLTRSSGNSLLDEACLDAARMTRQIPPPPSTFSKRGISVACEK